MYYAEHLYTRLLDIISLPSTSGHEELVRTYLQQQLHSYGLTTQVDATGNLIGTLPGEGPALLLNAHMDRVPPGLGHLPVLRDGVLYSDGQTNLGADDAAGLVIILEVLRRVQEQQLPHPPLVIVFTVQEEAGLCGAGGFDGRSWQVRDGIVFDNAFTPGVVVSQNAAYESFDVTLRGRTGHPGKDLSKTVNVLEIFHAAQFPLGSLANDRTRINIGRITGGSARNAIPETLHLEGEIRSFEDAAARDGYKQAVEQAFQQAARQFGGEAEVTFRTFSTGYEIAPDEPLLQAYRHVLAERGVTMEMQPTFITSDTSGFRPQIRAFTVSTGVVDEHSFAEHVALAPLEQIVVDTLDVLAYWQKQPGE
ncbi:MAG TPA: M20/M25/M40 family metallo-hydrolase [Ktedonobacteraceae bacterium]|jgi:tripeptide aminopeptidase